MTGLALRGNVGELLHAREVARATCDRPTRRTNIRRTSPCRISMSAWMSTRPPSPSTLAVLPAQAPLPTRVDQVPNDLPKLRRYLDRGAEEGVGRACYEADR